MRDAKIIVLISGNGSTLQAIIDAKIPIAAVISNRAHAYGLKRAQLANIPTHVLSHNEFTDRTEYDAALAKIIDQYQAQLIVLAGFMRILTPDFVKKYQGKLINIHPSLLPDYPGMHTHQRVLDAKETYHGSSIHFVNEELDGGPLIAQGYFAIPSEITLEALQHHVHELEHRLYPQVIQWYLNGKFHLSNNQVIWDDPDLAKQTSQGYFRIEM